MEGGGGEWVGRIVIVNCHNTGQQATLFNTWDNTLKNKTLLSGAFYIYQELDPQTTEVNGNLSRDFNQLLALLLKRGVNTTLHLLGASGSENCKVEWNINSWLLIETN